MEKYCHGFTGVPRKIVSSRLPSLSESCERELSSRFPWWVTEESATERPTIPFLNISFVLSRIVFSPSRNPDNMRIHRHKSHPQDNDNLSRPSGKISPFFFFNNQSNARDDAAIVQWANAESGKSIRRKKYPENHHEKRTFMKKSTMKYYFLINTTKNRIPEKKSLHLKRK